MIRRSAVLIPSSIAKGQARHETREFLTQLSFADGYLAELETQLLLSVDLGFCKGSEVEALLKEIDELQRMLNAITRKLVSNSPLATSHSPLLFPLAFSGIHVISPRLLPLLTETAPFSIIDSYLRLSSQSQKILAFRHDTSYWRDLGKPADLAQAGVDEQQKAITP